MADQKFRFHLVCPRCGKVSETVADRRIPQPHVNCGDCLMNRLKVVEFKVLKVEDE